MQFAVVWLVCIVLFYYLCLRLVGCDVTVRIGLEASPTGCLSIQHDAPAPPYLFGSVLINVGLPYIVTLVQQ